MLAASFGRIPAGPDAFDPLGPVGHVSRVLDTHCVDAKGEPAWALVVVLDATIDFGLHAGQYRLGGVAVRPIGAWRGLGHCIG